MFKKYLLRLLILTFSVIMNAIASPTLDLEQLAALSTATPVGLITAADGAIEEGSLDAFILKKNNPALIAQINQLTADLQNRDLIIANLQAQNAQLQNNINQLTADIQARDVQIVYLQNQVAQLQNNVNQLTLDVQTRDAEIVTLQGQNTQLQNSVNQLTLDVQARDAQIVTLQGQNTQLQDSVNQLTLDVQARDTQIVTLQNQVIQRNTTIQNGINKLDPTQGDLEVAITSVLGASVDYSNLFNSLPVQYRLNATSVFTERNLLIILFNMFKQINQTVNQIEKPNQTPATFADVTLLDLVKFVKQFNQLQ